ncbi:MAG: 3-oxoacyl-ACP reductase [Acidiphilium sp. 37-64-53]|uniref:SDR family NAD(P)-dependent oxidoreductase n=2 Tax=Acidiphilium TaxID=522 RepID=UPI000BCCDBB5|nr:MULTISPECIES: SDR family NAD(P)-dependent oxidoreductase [unclassified Acidiphilium]OYV99725.1 MAG: 3-oxoacyl-ACP reductase [Acidiphilium sp. 37-64-53]OZB23691.1 MAG: 3-oxoacyl-ACP reductase [Acidiphilium sp. 34-64-41]HQT90253.1 SDR family oxidoreductase [Acidiphilium sp.]
MLKLAGRRCLVTGAGGGIGQAIARGFTAEGATVAVLDLNAAAAHAAAAQCSGIAIVADVSEPQGVRRAVDEAVAALGGIDILVNNAGIDTNASVVDMTIETWDRMIEVNLRSVFLCTQAVLPPMISQGWGRIINISSQLAQKGAPQMAHYAAAKAGVIGFTRSLAYEVISAGVTVNAICPGPVNTTLWQNIPLEWRQRKLAELPIGRPAEVDEIVPTAVLLASEAGAYYVGATLNPNGGDVMV